MCHKSQPIADASQLVLVGRGKKRPIDEHRPSDYILARNEAPITAVLLTSRLRPSRNNRLVAPQCLPLNIR
jgi:hypothetical protein